MTLSLLISMLDDREQYMTQKFFVILRFGKRVMKNGNKAAFISLVTGHIHSGDGFSPHLRQWKSHKSTDKLKQVFVIKKTSHRTGNWTVKRSIHSNQL